MSTTPCAGEHSGRSGRSRVAWSLAVRTGAGEPRRQLCGVSAAQRGSAWRMPLACPGPQAKLSMRLPLNPFQRHSPIARTSSCEVMPRYSRSLSRLMCSWSHAISCCAISQAAPRPAGGWQDGEGCGAACQAAPCLAPGCAGAWLAPAQCLSADARKQHCLLASAAKGGTTHPLPGSGARCRCAGRAPGRRRSSAGRRGVGRSRRVVSMRVTGLCE